MMHKVPGRVLVDIVLFILVFIAPWWVTFIIALIGLFVYRNFYEIVVIGFLIDSLYNASVPHMYSIVYVMTFAALLALAISTYIKGRLRFYS